MEDQIFGEVYEDQDGCFCYFCEYCAYSCGGPRDEVEAKADDHEVVCHVKPYRYK